jgi:hypothetical protein
MGGGMGQSAIMQAKEKHINVFLVQAMSFFTTHYTPPRAQPATDDPLAKLTISCIP